MSSLVISILANVIIFLWVFYTYSLFKRVEILEYENLEIKKRIREIHPSAWFSND